MTRGLPFKLNKPFLCSSGIDSSGPRRMHRQDRPRQDRGQSQPQVSLLSHCIYIFSFHIHPSHLHGAACAFKTRGTVTVIQQLLPSHGSLQGWCVSELGFERKEVMSCWQDLRKAPVQSIGNILMFNRLSKFKSISCFACFYLIRLFHQYISCCPFFLKQYNTHRKCSLFFWGCCLSTILWMTECFSLWGQQGLRQHGASLKERSVSHMPQSYDISSIQMKLTHSLRATGFRGHQQVCLLCCCTVQNIAWLCKYYYSFSILLPNMTLDTLNSMSALSWQK